MHPELERRMLQVHIEQLHLLARRPPRYRIPDGSRAPRNRPRVRAGLVLMRVGARLARPALRPAVWPREMATGRG